MAQPARLRPCLLLQLFIAEALLLALLGGQHIDLVHDEACVSGEGQEGGKVKGVLVIVQLPVQLGALPGMGEEGVQLLQAHQGAAGMDQV